MCRFSVKLGSWVVSKLAVELNQARHTSIAFTNFMVGVPLQVRSTMLVGIVYLSSIPALV